LLQLARRESRERDDVKRTLTQTLAKIAGIIRTEGEITETSLIEKLEERGISFWTWKKLKPMLLQHSTTTDIKTNNNNTYYYVGSLESSLSTLSLPEKEELK